MPARMAHRFARDISNGPSFLSFLNSSGAFAWHCEGVVRSGALLEDMAVWEQVTRLVAVKISSFRLLFGILKRSAIVRCFVHVRPSMTGDR